MTWSTFCDSLEEACRRWLVLPLTCCLPHPDVDDVEENQDRSDVKNSNRPISVESWLVPPEKALLPVQKTALPPSTRRPRATVPRLVARPLSMTSFSSRRSRGSKSGRPVISAASNFRRVDGFGQIEGFLPLELSIHHPGNVLSPLPCFHSFLQDELPTRAHSALAPPISRCGSVFSEGTQSFTIPRKPVASGDSRTSLSVRYSMDSHLSPSTTATEWTVNPLHTQPGFTDSPSTQNLLASMKSGNYKRPLMSRAYSTTEVFQRRDGERAKCNLDKELTEPGITLRNASGELKLCLQSARMDRIEESTSGTAHLVPISGKSKNSIPRPDKAGLPGLKMTRSHSAGPSLRASVLQRPLPPTPTPSSLSCFAPQRLPPQPPPKPESSRPKIIPKRSSTQSSITRWLFRTSVIKASPEAALLAENKYGSQGCEGSKGSSSSKSATTSPSSCSASSCFTDSFAEKEACAASYSPETLQAHDGDKFSIDWNVQDRPASYNTYNTRRSIWDNGMQVGLAF